MTADQQRELDVVRVRLDRLCSRRALRPLADWEAKQYARLAELEEHLLTPNAAGRLHRGWAGVG